MFFFSNNPYNNAKTVKKNLLVPVHPILEPIREAAQLSAVVLPHLVRPMAMPIAHAFLSFNTSSMCIDITIHPSISRDEM